MAEDTDIWGAGGWFQNKDGTNNIAGNILEGTILSALQMGLNKTALGMDRNTTSTFNNTTSVPYRINTFSEPQAELYNMLMGKLGISSNLTGSNREGTYVLDPMLSPEQEAAAITEAFSGTKLGEEYANYRARGGTASQAQFLAHVDGGRVTPLPYANKTAPASAPSQQSTAPSQHGSGFTGGTPISLPEGYQGNGMTGPASIDPQSELARNLSAQGRDGDTIVAHINPEEAALLKALGGRGTINPNTGMLEFAWAPREPDYSRGYVEGGELPEGSEGRPGNNITDPSGFDWWPGWDAYAAAPGNQDIVNFYNQRASHYQNQGIDLYGFMAQNAAEGGWRNWWANTSGGGGGGNGGGGGGGNVPSYPRDMYLGPTEQDQAFFDAAQRYYDDMYNRPSAEYQYRPHTLEAIHSLMAATPAYDISPEATQRYWEETMQPIWDKNRDQLNESFAGPSFWSSARSRGLGEFNSQQAGAEANLFYQDELARRQALENAYARQAATTPAFLNSDIAAWSAGQGLDQSNKQSAIQALLAASNLSRTIGNEQINADLARWLMGETVDGVQNEAYDPRWSLFFSMLGMNPFATGSLTTGTNRTEG